MTYRLRQLASELQGRLQLPGGDGYLQATAPRNNSGIQTPAAVVQVRDAEDVSVALRHAARAGLRVAVQATGHGAAGAIGADVLLLDTSRLTALQVDPRRRLARVGAGVRALQLAFATERCALIAPLGTAPDVGVVGYALHGGVGWMTRAFGMASAALHSVEFVDGRGERHQVTEDGDLDAMWAFRGGGGVGVVVSVELQLFAVQELWGGYALWPMTHAHKVIEAWSMLVESADHDLSTVISTLRTPTAPAELRGQSLIYLGAASPDAGRAAPALARMLRGLPSPSRARFGACDAVGLSKIHLDPPVAVPAVGDGRWLNASARSRAREIITAAHCVGEPALAEVELRHVAGSTRGVDTAGALTRPPGDYLLHAVGLADSIAALRSIEQELATVRAVSRRDDTGRSAASFRDGQRTAPDAFEPSERQRLALIRGRFDPDGLVALPRPLS